MVYLNLRGPWTPANISGLAAWYDAQDADTITESLGSISQWDDKSGNGRHASQGTGSQQPTYNTTDADMNGFPSVGRDGDVLKRLQTAASFLVRETYVVAYYDSATFGSWDIMVGNADSVTGEPRFGGWSGADYFQDNYSDTIYKNASTVTNYADNTGKPVVLPMTISLWDNRWDADVTTRWSLLSQRQSWQRWGRYGALGEVVMTDGTESTADRNRIEGYLAWKWGIEGDLPAGHPYEGGPPQ